MVVEGRRVRAADIGFYLLGKSARLTELPHDLKIGARESQWWTTCWIEISIV